LIDLHLVATLGHRYEGEDADMRTTCCYKFIQVKCNPNAPGGHWAQSWWHVHLALITHGNVSKWFLQCCPAWGGHREAAF